MRVAKIAKSGSLKTIKNTKFPTLFFSFFSFFILNNNFDCVVKQNFFVKKQKNHQKVSKNAILGGDKQNRQKVRFFDGFLSKKQHFPICGRSFC
jgi:hypothetical protein